MFVKILKYVFKFKKKENFKLTFKSILFMNIFYTVRLFICKLYIINKQWNSKSENL